MAEAGRGPRIRGHVLQPSERKHGLGRTLSKFGRSVGLGPHSRGAQARCAAYGAWLRAGLRAPAPPRLSPIHLSAGGPRLEPSPKPSPRARACLRRREVTFVHTSRRIGRVGAKRQRPFPPRVTLTEAAAARSARSQLRWCRRPGRVELVVEVVVALRGRHVNSVSSEVWLDLALHINIGWRVAEALTNQDGDAT